MSGEVATLEQVVVAEFTEATDTVVIVAGANIGTAAGGGSVSDHLADTTAAHAASAISFTPNGSIAATDVQAAIQEVRDEAGGGGAPTTVDYLVGTASGDLSAEIVVGTSPGGELGGTWASPTVDATHSGSSHAGIQAAAEATAAAALTAHEGAANPHPTYLTQAEGDAAYESAGAVSTHSSDTTSVHGIADTSTLYRSGGTDIAVADGGTGASTAAAARTNLDVYDTATTIALAVAL